MSPHQARAADQLNRECFCVTLDQQALANALQHEVADADFFAALTVSHPHLFSHAPVFLPKADRDAMQAIVRAIEAAALLPAYQDAVLGWAPPIARIDHGPIGAFMGYDFHLTPEGPKLIEVNTNAGGAYLNALLRAPRSVLRRGRTGARPSFARRLTAPSSTCSKPNGDYRAAPMHCAASPSSMSGRTSNTSIPSLCSHSGCLNGMELRRHRRSARAPL